MRTTNKPKVSLSLIRPSINDVERICDIFSDEDSIKYMNRQYHFLENSESVKHFINNINNVRRDSKCIAFEKGIVRLVTAKIERESTVTGKNFRKEDIVGIVILRYNREIQNTVDVSFATNPNYRSRGIGTWIIKSIVKYIQDGLFNIKEMNKIEFKYCNPEVLKIARVQLCIPDGDIYAMKVAENSGFNLEGVLRNGFMIDNEYVDSYIYSYIPENVITFDVGELQEEEHNSDEDNTKQNNENKKDLSEALEILSTIEEENDKVIEQASKNNDALAAENEKRKVIIMKKQKHVEDFSDKKEDKYTSGEDVQTAEIEVKVASENIEVKKEEDNQENIFLEQSDKESEDEVVFSDNAEDDVSFSDLLDSMMESVEKESDSFDNNVKAISTDSVVTESKHLITKPVMEVISDSSVGVVDDEQSIKNEQAHKDSSESDLESKYNVIAKSDNDNSDKIIENKVDKPKMVKKERLKLKGLSKNSLRGESNKNNEKIDFLLKKFVNSVSTR